MRLETEGVPTTPIPPHPESEAPPSSPAPSSSNSWWFRVGPGSIPPPLVLEVPGATIEERLAQTLERALQFTLDTQDARGAWVLEPEPRLFDTSLVAYVLSRVDRPDAVAAVERARAWIQGFAPQAHDPYARLFEETPRKLLNGEAGVVDLRDPGLYSNLFRRKALILYVLARHAGADVLAPYKAKQIKEQVRQFYVRSTNITMKRWSKADLISIYAILEWLDGNMPAASGACQQLARMQADDGSYCHNPISTAIAFLALTCGAPGSPTWESCLAQLLSVQSPDGTWRFTLCDIWDTTLILRAYGDHPRFVAEAAPRSTRFILETQNPDGGWGFRTDVESNNDSASCALLALGPSEDEDVSMCVERGLAYLVGRRRKDGLWNTWQSNDDHPVEDCVAHVSAALMAFRGTHTPVVKAAQRWLEQQYEENGRWRAGWYRSLPYSTREGAKGLRSGHPIAYAAVRALRATQNPDGGFPLEPGEESSASATGLAVAALAEHYDIHQPFLRDALNYLIKTQEADGSWGGRVETYGPRPLLTHFRTTTHAFVGFGLMAAWRRAGTRTGPSSVRQS
jgi:squalene-hopene/tetraprenyl-beta-curcumene cyclase